MLQNVMYFEFLNRIIYLLNTLLSIYA